MLCSKSHLVNCCTFSYLLDNLIDDGRLREAREVLKESVQKNPNTLNDFYVVFIEEYENGFEATKEAYRKLVEKYPEDWSASPTYTEKAVIFVHYNIDL